ncbi:hypothetical protein [Citrobacter sp. wls714]|uniref:hypothetical protein n=1 Tax=Citrobacter sp. wls714 TaxID=2576422 RepID=UPI001BB0C8E2|nr:hypothetical protein [Citrobacter sp. wls714]
MNVNTKFDLWLVRFSYIAQIAILFITVFTLFYTVIPLYQNAALQESIAKKEFEMKTLKEKISLLNSNFMHEAVRTFSFQAVNICSPSLPFLLQPMIIPSKEPSERRENNLKKVSEYRKALDKDVYNCLVMAANNSTVLSKLNKADFDKVLLVIDSIKTELNDLKRSAQTIINDNNTLEKIGLREGNSEVDNFIVSMGVTQEQIQQEKESSALVDGATEVFYKYGKDVMTLISDSFGKMN